MHSMPLLADGFDHGADDGVQTRRVAAAGENADAFDGASW